MKLIACIFGIKKGTDKFGNIYYKDKRNNNRFVIYKDKNEPTNICSRWHGWLHYTEDLEPTDLKISFEKDRVFNLTGTNKSYKPKSDSASRGVHLPWSPH